MRISTSWAPDFDMSGKVLIVNILQQTLFVSEPESEESTSRKSGTIQGPDVYGKSGKQVCGQGS